MAGLVAFGFSVARSSRQIHTFGRCCSLEVTRSVSSRPSRPKRPLTGFIKFSQSQQMPANTSLPERAIMNGKSWNLLTNEQKEVYKPTSAVLEAYNKQLAEWEQSLTEEQRAEIKSEAAKRREKLTKFRLRKKCKELGMPVKGAISGWALYLASLPIQRGDTPLPVFIKDLAQEWRKLPEEEKKRFEEEAVKTKTKYFKALEKWEKEMIQLEHYDIVRKASLPDYINRETRKPKIPKEGKAKSKSRKAPKKDKDTSWMREE